MKRTLGNYFYITHKSECVGWVSSVKQGMELLEDVVEMNDYERQACVLLMKSAFKYYDSPAEDHERMSIFPSFASGGVVAIKGGDKEQEYFLGSMSPMLFKGLDSRLGTIVIGGEEYHFTRANDVQALPPSAWLALIQCDVDSYYNSGVPFIRENSSRRVNRPACACHLELICGDYSCRVGSLDEAGIMAALDGLHVGDMSEDDWKVVQLVAYLWKGVQHGLLTIAPTQLFQHVRTGGIVVGNIPVTFGHPGSYRKVGGLFTEFVSDRPGKVCRFVVNGFQVLIRCVED